MKKISLWLGVLAVVLLGSACGPTTYEFEADPVDGSNTEPRQVSCFMVEADGPTDDEDIALGEFCKPNQGGDSVEEQGDFETEGSDD